MRKWLAALAASIAVACLVALPAAAQWQVCDHCVAIGNGAGVTGFASAAPGTSGQALVSTGASSDPAFGNVSLTAGVTGTLPVSNGGSGATSLTGIILGNGTSPFTGITTSAGIAGAISDETGSGGLVFGTSPTLGTPTITAGGANVLTFSANGAGSGTYLDCFPGNAAGFQNTECRVISSNSAAGFSLRMKGDWPFVLHAPADASNAAQMCMYEDESNGSNRMCWYANPSIPSSFTMIWPSGVPASGTQALMVASSGVMSYQSGLSQSISVRNAANSGSCTLTVTNGLITATTC
jgi:hypothetical protein